MIERDHIAARTALLELISLVDRIGQSLVTTGMEARLRVEDDTWEDYMVASAVQIWVRRAGNRLAELEDVMSDLACIEDDCGYSHVEPRTGEKP